MKKEVRTVHNHSTRPLAPAYWTLNNKQTFNYEKIDVLISTKTINLNYNSIFVYIPNEHFFINGYICGVNIWAKYPYSSLMGVDLRPTKNKPGIHTHKFYYNTLGIFSNDYMMQAMVSQWWFTTAVCSI